MLATLKKYFFNLLERKTNAFFTMHFRPKTSVGINTQSDRLKREPKLGLVIQGPIIKENDFTLESLKLYHKHFGETIFILSVWDDENQTYLQKFKALELETVIILNAKPAYAGQSNINYQIVSSLAGIKKAQALGCEYVLKTRTDQRIYAPNVKEFLLNIIAAFPVRGVWAQKQRIVGLSLNTYKYRPYGLSDMTLFGQIDDMLLYWSVALDQRPIADKVENTSRAFYNLRICEMYLLTEFLQAIGRPIDWTIKDSWRVYADHLCVVDQQSLDLYWFKYLRYYEYRRLDYGAIRNCRVMTFGEWFNLYQGLDNKVHAPEEAMDAPFDGEIKI